VSYLNDGLSRYKVALSGKFLNDSTFTYDRNESAVASFMALSPHLSQ